MSIYTFRPSRGNSGYDIVLLGGYHAVESVNTRFEAEQAVRRFNLKLNDERLATKKPFKPRKNPRGQRKKGVAYDFEIPDGFLEALQAAKPYIRRGKLGVFYQHRADLLSCSTTYLFARMPKVRG